MKNRIISFTLVLFYPLLMHNAMIAEASNLDRDYYFDSPQVPINVDASDGVYDKFVLIRWKAVVGEQKYKVFRTTNPKGKALQEISKGWQKSTWLCDYTAIPGVDYYYAIAALDGDKMSQLSEFDKGFVKNEPVAIDEPLLADNPLHGTPPKPFLQLSEIVLTEQAYAVGEEGKLNFRLENIFEKEIPRTELRVVLSKDNTWDWDDEILDEIPKVFSDFPPESNFDTTINFIIPEKTIPGDYYLILISSLNGEVLQSRTSLSPIKVIP